MLVVLRAHLPGWCCCLQGAVAVVFIEMGAWSSSVSLPWICQGGWSKGDGGCRKREGVRKEKEGKCTFAKPTSWNQVITKKRKREREESHLLLLGPSKGFSKLSFVLSSSPIYNDANFQLQTQTRCRRFGRSANVHVNSAEHCALIFVFFCPTSRSRSCTSGQRPTMHMFYLHAQCTETEAKMKAWHEVVPTTANLESNNSNVSKAENIAERSTVQLYRNTTFKDFFAAYFLKTWAGQVLHWLLGISSLSAYVE
ncbi:hypothetical protein EI94DRAFT_1702089 [Lactarius quietus]|nr:hypothetical protein EI94DRAFT_1702089 [Lactarius quietus]